MSNQKQSQPQKDDVNYREVFRDIAFGYSSFLFENQLVYIKHLSVFDQVNIEELKEKSDEK